MATSRLSAAHTINLHGAEKRGGMKREATIATIVLTGICLASSTIAGQPTTPQDGRTPWGDPDLQGLYTSATYTPLERPEPLGE